MELQSKEDCFKQYLLIIWYKNVYKETDYFVDQQQVEVNDLLKQKICTFLLPAVLTNSH
jgi:hypothetical protein